MYCRVKKTTYSLWVDPIQGPLSFSSDTRHCLYGIEKLLSEEITIVSVDYRGGLSNWAKSGLKFGQDVFYSPK